jgi:hypothetical protein
LKISEPFLEPTHYETKINGKPHHWSIRLIYYHDFSFERPDRWFIEQKWGKAWKPEKQHIRLEFDSEVKAREKFDELVYSKKQEGFRPVFK